MKYKALTISERERLTEYITENLTPFRLGILICLNTGLRLGEICALQWRDISFDNQCLSVRRGMRRIRYPSEEHNQVEQIFVKPKSESSIRQIPLPDNLFKILIRCREEEKAFLLTGSVNDYMEPRTVQGKFRELLKECGIQEVNFHTLRYTFAEERLKAGVDFQSLNQMLGLGIADNNFIRYWHPSVSSVSSDESVI